MSNDSLSAEAVANRMVMRLRTEALRRKSINPRWSPGTEVADLVAAAAGAGEPTEMVNALRCAAVALAAARQSFMASFDLSDLNMTEVMPLITHLSQIAESLVIVADDLATDSLSETAADLDDLRPAVHPFESPDVDEDDEF